MHGFPFIFKWPGRRSEYLKRLSALVFAAFLLCVLSGCKVPKDPNHTLEKVQGGIMRVGVTPNPPWASSGGNGGDGIEMRLVRELAEELDAQIEWRYGPEHELMTALEHFELDLVIGGLVKPTPWRKQVALSRPYYESAIVIADAADRPQLRSIEGRRIAVPPDTAIAAYVRAKGGIAVPSTDAGSSGLPHAVPGWRAYALGWKPGLQLKKLQHVMALAPGENRWIVTVERFLHKRKNEIPTLINRVTDPRQHDGATP